MAIISSNKLARTELLIILSYLLKKTDKEHLSKQTDIEEYAINNFNVTIKRQRITEILENLKEISDEYEGLVPFKVESVNTGTRSKYYISNRTLNEEAISTIINAIKNDKYIPVDETNILIEKLLKVNANEYIKETILNQNKDNNYTSKKSQKAKEDRKLIQNAIDNKLFIEFKVSDIRLLNSSSPVSYSAIFDKDYLFKGYPHSIKKFDNIDYVLFVIPSQRDLICVPLTTLKIQNIIAVGEVQSLDTAVNLYEGYDSIEEYLNDNILPFDGKLMKIRFSFELNESNLDTLHDSFKNFFNKSFTYTKETKTKTKNIRVDGVIKEVIDEVEFGVVELKMQKNLFLEWLSNPIIESIVEDISPSELKSTLIFRHLNSLFKLTSDKSIIKEFIKDYIVFSPSNFKQNGLIEEISIKDSKEGIPSNINEQLKQANKDFISILDKYANNLEMCFIESSKQTKTVAELLFTRSVLSMLNINMQQYKNNVNYNSLVDDINKIKLDKKIDCYIDYNDYISYAVEIKAIAPTLGLAYQAKSTLINLFNLSNIKNQKQKTIKKYLVSLITEKDNESILNVKNNTKSHNIKYKEILELERNKKLIITEADYIDVNGTKLSKDNSEKDYIKDFAPFSIRCIYKERLIKSSYYIRVFEIL